MNKSVHEKVVELLDGRCFRLVEHAEAETSEEAARIRGSRLEQGAKALVLRSKGEYLLFVVSAARELDAKALRAALKLKSLSFASAPEVEEKFGLLKGSVPPFGSVLGIRTIADNSLRAANEGGEIVFNAGLRSKSIFIPFSLFEELEKPIWVDASM